MRLVSPASMGRVLLWDGKRHQPQTLFRAFLVRVTVLLLFFNLVLFVCLFVSDAASSTWGLAGLRPSPFYSYRRALPVSRARPTTCLSPRAPRLPSRGRQEAGKFERLNEKKHTNAHIRINTHTRGRMI